MLRLNSSANNKGNNQLKDLTEDQEKNLASMCEEPRFGTIKVPDKAVERYRMVSNDYITMGHIVKLAIKELYVDYHHV